MPPKRNKGTSAGIPPSRSAASLPLGKTHNKAKPERNARKADFEVTAPSESSSPASSRSSSNASAPSMYEMPSGSIFDYASSIVDNTSGTSKVLKDKGVWMSPAPPENDSFQPELEAGSAESSGATTPRASGATIPHASAATTPRASVLHYAALPSTSSEETASRPSKSHGGGRARESTDAQVTWECIKTYDWAPRRR